MSELTGIWMWRAWAHGRSRICDCGMVYADTEDKARSYISMCIGGPWRRDVVEIDVERVAEGRPLTPTARGREAMVLS